ncbi:MAG: PSD1 and planctomycete cytochrome C domain-containing protein [Pirellulales bacterium]
MSLAFPSARTLAEGCRLFRVLATVAATFSWVGGPLPAQDVDFNRDVRPLLSNRCFKCHGPDEEKREAGLRLDVRDAAITELDSGTRAIVAGHPADSELIARITSDDPDLVMPPPHLKTSLSEDEQQILTAWIEQGAPYAPHWAFVPPVRPPLPEVDRQGWARTPIDRFVLARLEAEGLEPSAEADRGSLCRRVSLDLIGLPPTPEELAAFLADESADAYERLVDRLLASPRYGERWARRWLDLARYADTNGYEKDRPREIWPYRDWVIRALNDDMPFDAFTIRQIAGDMLPQPTVDDIVATGFHRNTMINEEGGIDPLEFRYLAMVDRVGTTGTTWLGLTTGCAQCHTHKFDPLTHTDYFSLMALLNNADEPEWIIPSEEQAARQAAVAEQIEAAWEALPGRWPAPEVVADAGPTTAEEELAERFSAWNAAESQAAVDWRICKPQLVSSTMPHLVVRDDATILASGDATKSDVYELTLPAGETAVRALRLEVLSDPSLPAHGPGMTSYEGPKGDFFLSELEITAAGKAVAVASASESFAGTAFAGKVSGAAGAIDGEMSSGWTTNGQQGRPHAAVFVLAEAVPAGEPLQVTMRFERHYACPLGCFRFSVTDAETAAARGHTADEEAALQVVAADRTEAQQRLVFRRFLESATELAEPMAEIRRLEDALQQGTRTLVMAERPAENPRATHRHHRGEYTQPEERVAPAVPGFLPQLPADESADRLALAKWLVSRDNPLSARVTVNRQWQAFFGTGLVPTLEDLGYQSEPPTHPELLDFLGVTFMDDCGWSLKQLHRLIVTSSTYRQASAVSPELAAIDPGNRLLARGPSIRLEAEVIRDAMLAAAGLLSDKMYGPGVRPPQPAGVTEVAYGSPGWTPSEGEDRHRRSVYTFQKRTAPFAMSTTFDGPTGESCLARREVSNSPLQALTLLNDPMFLEVAGALGAVAAAAEGPDAAKLEMLSLRLLSRPLTEAEAGMILAYLAHQRERLAAGELDAKGLLASAAVKGEAEFSDTTREHAAWMLVARALMNLDEAIVKR